MLRTILLLALSTTLGLTLKAKKSPFQLGKVSNEELSIDICPIDSNADAYYIFDIGKTKITTNWGGIQIQYNRKQKIKILSTDGAEIANQIITLHKSLRTRNDEFISKIKAYTYNLENGKVERIKLESKNIIHEEVNKYRERVKFTLPNVKKGSIIEIEYEIVSPYVYEFHEWYFQNHYPVIYSEYTALIPDFLEYNKDLTGFIHVDVSKPEIKTDNLGYYISNSEYQSFIAHNVPAFKVEAFVPNPDDFRSCIRYSLSDVIYKNGLDHFPSRDTWESYDISIGSDDAMGEYLLQKKTAERILETWNQEGKTKLELMNNCFFALQETLKWNGSHDYVHTDLPKKIWSEKVGNSADLNLMLILLLREYGITASPILVSTRDHGYIKRSFPSDRQYNHVICKATIDSVDYLMDLTGKASSPETLPLKDLTLWGRDLAARDWISLERNSPSVEKSFLQLHINDDMKLTGQGQVSLSDYLSFPYRIALIENQGNETILANQIRQEHPDLDISDISFSTNPNKQCQLAMKLKFESNTHVQNLGSVISVKPFVLEDLESNLLTDEERHCPVDFGFPFTKMITLQIEIPEGYSVSTMPKNAKIYLPNNGGSIEYKCDIIGSNLTIVCNSAITQSIYHAEHYPHLKEFFKQAFQKMNEPILFEKS